jgi:LmbE family N-acetylglucosaminyl deacetylase
MKRLVLAPHCDDETLGCGGLLAKYPDTGVLVATSPDAERRGEFDRAQKLLGFAHACFLDFKDGYVGADMRRLVGALDDVIGELRPDELYLPFPSMHQDHIAVYEAGIRAGRLSMNPDHWFTPSIYVYDVAAYDVNMYPTDLKWNVFESLSEEHVNAKVAALKEYSSQAVVGPHPINGIKELAQASGQARHLDFAEPFALIRHVR